MPPLKLKPIAQQTMVITGATSGIGLAIARKAARRGAKLLIAARCESDLRNAQAELRALTPHMHWVAADVGEEAGVRRIADAAMQQFGGLDTWVNNAGVGIYGAALDVPLADQERLFRTNYWGVVHGATIAAKHLRSRPGGGALITIGSIVSDIPAPLMASCAASKHAVKGLIDTLRGELADERAPVSVTLVKPSGIDTPFDTHARNRLPYAAQLPTPLYSPEIVADAVLYAAQHKVREITAGGSGRILISAVRAAPKLADSWLPALMIPKQQDRRRQPLKNDSLDRPFGDNTVHADHGRPIKFDAFMAARTHPRLSLALLGVGLGAAWLAASTASPAKDQTS
jgi:short-subunit dehydrogenase